MRLRLALWYALVIGSAGALHPFFAVVLSSLGAPTLAIAALGALFPLGMVAAGPLWGWVADRSGRPGVVLRRGAAVAAVAAIALAAAPTWAWMAVPCLLLAMSRTPLIPLVDVLTLKSLGDHPEGYGRIRLWGSITFLAVVLALGHLVEAWPRASLVATAILLTLCVPLAFSLPQDPESQPSRLDRTVGRLLHHPGLAPLWPVALLHGTALSTYDHLFSLHIQRLGLPASVTGNAVAAGVVAETLVMAAAPFLLRSATGATWMRVAVLISVPRWLLTAQVIDPTLQILIQASHGFTFGCWWIGGVKLLGERAPRDLRNSAQALFIATTHGMGSLGAMLITALVADRWGTGALFQLGAALSALATLLVFRRSVATPPTAGPVGIEVS